jgi:hypothetical protein
MRSETIMTIMRGISLGVLLSMSGVAWAKKPARPSLAASGSVDVVLVGKQANADKRKRCRENRR